ncbi:hypothetical protein WA577_002591, partial [Blastocystis sp. JDR]
MSENLVEDPFYSIDAVMYESKKKKNPNIPVDPKDLEEDVKGKKMKITFDGVKLVYNKHVLLVDDMIAVASAKPKEIIIHSLPRIGKGYRERYWKKSKIVFATREQASEWFNIVNTAIENGRYTERSERGPIVEFKDDTRVKRVRVIVNPHGGKGDAQQVFNTRILPLLQLAGIQCDLEITKYYANAKDMAITHEPDKYEGVLLVSGDGLVNEFVNGLMQRVDSCYAIYNTPICHVSAGTQNQISGGIGTTCYETAAYCIIKHKVKALDVLRVSPKNMPIQYSLCGVVAGIGGDMVKDYESYRVYGCMRYPLLKLKWGVFKRQKHVTDLEYTPVSDRIQHYQMHKCSRTKANCPVCIDGHHNYFYKPLKCPHAPNNQDEDKTIHPEDSSDSDSDSLDSLVLPAGFSAACSCEYPRWCQLVSNREWISDDLFEITQEEEGCCGRRKRVVEENHTERVVTVQKPVEETDLQYLTIGIVVNAPYDGEYCHCCDGSLDLIVARSGTCCQTVGLLGRYVTRTHLKSPLMDYIKAKSVVLRNPGENTVNVDGEELTYEDELKVEVCEAGVTCYG